MANTYGVTPADVAAELPGLFPGGFTVNTTPTLAKVQEWIDTADLRVTIRVQDVAAAIPLSSDRIAPLAKRAIIDQVISQVLRIIYTANAPQDVQNAIKPYLDSSAAQLASIEILGAQAAGTGEPVNRLRASTPGDLTRDLIVQDVDLNPGPAGHGSGYFGGRRQGQF